MRVTRQRWEVISCAQRSKQKTEHFGLPPTQHWTSSTGKPDAYRSIFSLRNPLQKPASTGNPYVRLLEDRTGTVWIASARDGLAFVDRQRKALTFVSLAPGRNIEPGAWAILEDRKGALWVGTEYGLIRLDVDRKQLLRYRNDPSDPRQLARRLGAGAVRRQRRWHLGGHCQRAEWLDSPLIRPRFGVTGALTGLRALFRTDYVVFAYEDSHGVIWAGTKGAINRIDLKTGRYDIQPIGENTEVGSIAEDRSGQFWIGTFDGSLFRFNPITQAWVAYPHHAGASGCANNEVRALLVDHQGTLWAGAGDSLCSFDPAVNRFRRYKIGVPAPAEIDALAEDSFRRPLDRFQTSRPLSLRSSDNKIYGVPAFRGSGQFKRRWSDFHSCGSFRNHLGWNIARA